MAECVSPGNLKLIVAYNAELRSGHMTANEFGRQKSGRKKSRFYGCLTFCLHTIYDYCYFFTRNYLVCVVVVVVAARIVLVVGILCR